VKVLEAKWITEAYPLRLRSGERKKSHGKAIGGIVEAFALTVKLRQLGGGQGGCYSIPAEESPRAYV